MGSLSKARNEGSRSKTNKEKYWKIIKNKHQQQICNISQADSLVITKDKLLLIYKTSEDFPLE